MLFTASEIIDIEFDISPTINLNIDSNIFTKDIHRNIQNLSYCFGNIRNAKGTVPEFWAWLNALPLDQRKSPFIYMSKENIRNSSSIPEAWNLGMI